MTSDPVKELEERYHEIGEELVDRDDPLVQDLGEYLLEIQPLGDNPPDYEPEEWLTVLEGAGDLIYLAAFDRVVDEPIKWVVRYHQEVDEIVYGTEKVGELYIGEKARGQAKAVAKMAQFHPNPIEQYPIRKLERGEYIDERVGGYHHE